MNSKNSDSAVTIENLESAIDRYRREDVLRMLKKGVLDGLADEEQEYFYCRLASLRSMEILDYLSRRKACFPAKMMQLDFDMSQNRSFVLEAMEKYHKKFNLSDDEECSQLFAIACAVGDSKTVKNLIRKKKAVDCYPLAGSAPFPVFIQVSQIAADALSNDQWIELYLGAFISRDGYARMDYMLKQGLDLFRKNEEGKTAADLLEERTTSYRYGNKKNGRYQKIQEEQLLSELRKLQATLEQPPEEKHSRKRMIAIACACLAAAFVISATVYYVTWDDEAEATESTAEMDDSEEAEITEETDTTTADSGDSEASEEEASYSTDSSLTVADGDTVNIDYTGYIDDVAFDGGSTNGSGTDLTIGSGSYIDDFEEQLIGYHPGDTVSVTVTFPEDYGNEELNGQEAVFEVTINGIYQ